MPRMLVDVIAALGRVLMSLIFIVSGIGKLVEPGGTIAYFGSLNLPVPVVAYPVPVVAYMVAYIVAVVCEVGGGIALLLGFWTRAVAVVLVLFCLFTAYTVHYVPAETGQMVNFWKNLAMAGGSLQLVAWGAGAWSLDRFLAERR